MTLPPSREYVRRLKKQRLHFRFSDNREKILDEKALPLITVNQPNIQVIQQPTKKQITGKVLDEDGDPIIGANIVEIGTTNGTVTDSNGEFSLNVNDNASIRISYIGFLEQSLNTSNKTSFNIVLIEDTRSLEELVVVGYGVQKKINLTGAIASVNAEDLSKVPTPNVSTLLYGQLPGLITLQRSGEPGLDNVALSIRGFSNALVVVDGVVGRNFSRLDPNEIENITILKDAASSAVYGVSGGNGVILVTTKRKNRETHFQLYHELWGSACYQISPICHLRRICHFEK